MAVSSAIAQDFTKPVSKDGTTGVNPLPNTNQFEQFEILFEDDFESYDDFVLEFGDWTLIDVDGRPVYGFTGVTFPNTGEPNAFIVFNPETTDPPLDSEDAEPLPGQSKYAACFAAVPGEGVSNNDDWMITPKVTLGTDSFVRFFAKSYIPDYGLERMRIGVSTGNATVGDMEIISSEPYEQVPADEWTEYQFDLSEYDGQAVHVGINCVSADAFILFVDDITIEAIVEDVELGPFSLLSPENGAALTLTPDDDTLVEISWEPSENATNYSWRAVAPGGDFADPLLELESDNNGSGTTLTLPVSAIYDTLVDLGVDGDGSLEAEWTVWATAGAGDPAQADEVFTITFDLQSGGTSIDPETGLPTTFSLSANYPNPFNPTTNISFDLPQTSEVTLEVFNVQGQKVATLVNGSMSAGSHTVPFSAENLSSGIYLYRMTAGSFIQTNKMTLVK